MRAIAAKARERKSENRDSIFYVRGKEVPFDEVARYWKRRGVLLEDVVPPDAMSMPPDVQCVTPAPGTPAPSPTRSTPSPPLAVAVPEQALQRLSIYIKGSFEAQRWLSISETEFAISTKANSRAAQSALTGHMDLLHNQVRQACFLFSRSRFAEGGRCLDVAIAGVRELTKLEYPPLLDRLPRTLVYAITDQKLPWVAVAVLREFAAAASEYLGPFHPFHQFCQLIANMEETGLIGAIYVAMSIVRDAFHSVLGPFHRTTLSARYGYVRTVCASQGQGAEAQGLSEIFNSCATGLPQGDLRTVKARSDLALFLQRSGSFAEGKVEAGKIVEETVSRAMSWQREKRVVMLCARAYSCQAECEYKLGSIEVAMILRKLAIELYLGLGSEETAHVEEESFWLQEWMEEAKTGEF